MFIESEHGGWWNLGLVTSFWFDERTGVFHLVFPVDGGTVKIRPDHPHYRQIGEHLRAGILPHDQPV